ncbi:hypothetical protein [Fibrobacter succinogenes]|uniref:Lipoprotein n=1 Tax=Fibrobacter succinogenes TaxID=833 RepID=A0A380S615_FIBSU|nr:hypothetical protein [Fibrobacter succinogenes]PWJ35350.1 hypothetical protein IE02_1396 [Fibrobacter succinogenes subsp. elongatus]SUQ24006.1 hypothetical protein SAMN05661053_1396 [Fibrobacter succinogenes]
MRFLLLAVAFLLLSTNCFAKDWNIEDVIRCGSMTIDSNGVARDKRNVTDSLCSEYYREQKIVQVKRDTLNRYLVKHSAFDKKNRKLKFSNLNIQKFSQKNNSNENALYSYISEKFLGEFSVLFPEKRIEKNGYWLVYCSASWKKGSAIHDGDAAFCISKNAVWPCYSEWEKEKSSR